MEASIITSVEKTKITDLTPKQRHDQQVQIADSMSKVTWQCHCDTHPHKHPNGCCICAAC